MRTMRLVAGLALGSLLAFLMGCSCPGPRGADGVDQARAIEIAKARVLTDGVMTLDQRDVVAVDEGAVWHISFPYSASANRLGGEPHVRVAKKDGTVTDIRYTQ